MYKGKAGDILSSCHFKCAQASALCWALLCLLCACAQLYGQQGIVTALGFLQYKHILETSKTYAFSNNDYNLRLAEL